VVDDEFFHDGLSAPESGIDGLRSVAFPTTEKGIGRKSPSAVIDDP
jgi:hypothetical protein